MAFFGFIKNFGKQKVQQTGQSIVQILATWDPDTSSAAEIQQMEERLDKLTQQVAQAKQTYQKEQKEADVIEALYEQRLKAAEILQARLSEGGENSAQVEKALTDLVNELESMQPDIEREMEEAGEAKAFMEELEEVAKVAAEKLRNGHKTLEAAKRDMARSKIREQRAKEKTEHAAMLAGLRNETDQLGSALAAMRKETEKSNAKAEAMNLKTRLLAPTKEEKADSLIAEAMAQASGGSPKPSNIADRLAALKKK